MSEGKAARPVRRDELRKFKNVCVVFGTRRYNDVESFRACLEGFIRDHKFEKDNTVFVTGMAPTGADRLIYDWCNEFGWRWHECHAKWDDITVSGARIKVNGRGEQYNALAGFQRNQEMANVSGYGLGFWDGKSPGTGDMVNKCQAKAMRLRLIRIKENNGS